MDEQTPVNPQAEKEARKEAQRKADRARAMKAKFGRFARIAAAVLGVVVVIGGLIYLAENNDVDQPSPLSGEVTAVDHVLGAVFVDFENLALGVEQDKKGRFEIELVLKRLLERGRIVFKRAYCDWTRFKDFMYEFHRQGFEMVDIPSSKVSGKNSADIRMVVDAIDLCYSKSHIDTFVLVTGDSDFSPVVSKLKENDKRVVGCGVRSSTSDLLANNCDEFIFYDDLIRVQKRTQQRTQQRRKPKKESTENVETTDSTDKRKQEAFERLVATVSSLETDYDPVWGSLVKPTLKRVYPGFNETYYGYRNFTELLEDAAKEGLIQLELDPQRGNYRVRSAH